MTALLLLSCSSAPDGGDADTHSDTEVDSHTDTPPETSDSNVVEDTGFQLDTDAIYHPVPGVTVDRGSRSYFRVLRQPGWCYVIEENTATETFTVLMIGLSDGSTHRLATGLSLPAPMTFLHAVPGNRLAHNDDYLFVAGQGGTARLHVDTATFDTAATASSWIAHFGSGLVVGDGEVYAGWNALVTGTISRSLDVTATSTTGTPGDLWDVPPVRGSQPLEVALLRTSDGSVRRTWPWSSLQASYDAIAVLPDGPIVVARHADTDSLSVHDLRAGTLLDSLPLPGVGVEYHGPSCTSGAP